MFACTLIVLAGVAFAYGAPPPYVQSREAFAHTRTYVSQLLTPDVLDFHDPETRTHYSGGILAGVTAGLVLADPNATDYHPLRVVDTRVPYSWRNYKVISAKAQELLNEASQKIQAISDLIDVICDAESISQCNAKVHSKVVNSPHIYQLPAELLLQLGKASQTIRHLEPRLNTVTQARQEIPYLIDNVETKELKCLVAELKTAYTTMRKLQFRRYDQDFE